MIAAASSVSSTTQNSANERWSVGACDYER
jgi:hypothetical protein